MKQNELAQPTLVDQSVEEVKAFRDKLKFMFENGVLPKSYLDVKANEKDKECTLISEASLNRAMARRNKRHHLQQRASEKENGIL